MLSDIDQLLPEHIESSICDENPTIPKVKSSGPNILSRSITVILIMMASGPHVCCICCFCCCRCFVV